MIFVQTQNDILIPSDIPTSMTEAEAIALGELARDRMVLEMGAWCGFSTVVLAQTAYLLVSVDHHKGDEHAGEASSLVPFLKNMGKYGALEPHVAVCISDFKTIVPLFSKCFDLVFIDGAHDEDSFDNDLTWALHVLREPGHIACHDYGTQASSFGGAPFGVKTVLDRSFDVATVVDSLAIVEVPHDCKR